MMFLLLFQNSYRFLCTKCTIYAILTDGLEAFAVSHLKNLTVLYTAYWCRPIYSALKFWTISELPSMSLHCWCFQLPQAVYKIHLIPTPLLETSHRYLLKPYCCFLRTLLLFADMTFWSLASNAEFQVSSFCLNSSSLSSIRCILSSHTFAYSTSHC